LRARSWPKPLLVAGLLAVVVLGAVSVRTIVERSSESDAWRRPKIWGAVAPAMLERPLLGLGPGSYRHAHHPYNFPVESRVGRFGSRATTPHGEWLRLPIELGLAGCLLLVALVGLRLRRGSARAWPILAAIAPIALVHDCFQAPAIAAWFALVFALGTEGDEKEDGEEPAWLSRERPELALALVLAGTLAAAGLVLRPSLADAAAQRGDLGRALAWNAAQPHWWLEAGRAAAAGDSAAQLAAASLCLDEAALLVPRWPEPDLERGRLLASAAQRFRPDARSREAAAAAWTRAAERAPWDAFLLVEQAAFLAQTGASHRALALTEAALELEPHFTDATLVALIAARAAELEDSSYRARAEAALAALPELRERVSRDYEHELLEPDARLLAAAGLD
jgi:hypothetical protein